MANYARVEGLQAAVLEQGLAQVKANSGMRDVIRQVWRLAGFAHACSVLVGWGAKVDPTTIYEKLERDDASGKSESLAAA